MTKKGHIELALARALRSTKTQPGDAAIEALAKQYARTLDAPRLLTDVASGPMVDLAMAASLHELGAGFRAVLVELGLTPKTRAMIMRGQPQEAPRQKSALDELREKREQRGTA